MEMPEGYKRLKNAAALLELDHIIWISRGDKDSILDLMKEMAEALDRFNYSFKDCPMSDCGHVAKEFEIQAKEALKKFKEWK